MSMELYAFKCTNIVINGIQEFDPSRFDSFFFKSLFQQRTLVLASERVRLQSENGIRQFSQSLLPDSIIT